MGAQHGQTHYKYNDAKHEISFNSSTSTKQTNPIGSNVSTVRLVSDEDCYIVFEDTKDASQADGITLKAGVVEYFVVDYGEKISALGVSASGTLEIAEMTL